MAVLKTVLTVVFIIISIALTVIILLQEGKSAGLTSSFTGGGGSDSYWNKNKGRSKEGALEKATKILAVAFILLSILLQLDL